MAKNKKEDKKVVAKNSTKKIDKNVDVPVRSNTATYIFLIILIIAFVVLAEFFTNKKVQDIILSKLEYFENGTVDYKVYYEKNPFYTDEYIGKNKTYITQYVDTISADFDYYTGYTNIIGGSYTYLVKATLKVYEPGKEANVYWAPTYDLVKKETVDIGSKSSYKVFKNVKIDYKKYLKEYYNYKSKSSLSTNAKLIVEFIINNDGKYEGIDNIDHTSRMQLEIPLSDPSFNIKINSSITSDKKVFSNVENNKTEKVIVKTLSVICWIGALVCAVVLFALYRSSILKESEYSRILRKILNSYDSIIVNVQDLPDISGLNIVNVTTFEELVDAQMEVRLPINFMENTKKHEAVFVLIRNNIAWVYTLKEDVKNEK